MDEALEVKEIENKAEGFNGVDQEGACGEIRLSATLISWFKYSSNSKMKRIGTHKPAKIDA